MIFTIQIMVMPLKELLDPQGKAVHSSLQMMQFNSIKDVRIGKHITLQIEANSGEEAKSIAEEACKKMLHNPVMEKFHVVVE
jgi:phosphoribosylformylglycinamidine synthase subunit PurS